MGERFHGKGGSVTIGNAIYHIYRWSMVIAADIRDVTAFGDTWQQKVVGKPGATFDIDGYLDSAAGSVPIFPTTAGAVGTTIDVVLLQDTTIGYTGVGVIGSMNIETAHDGAADISLSGEFATTVFNKT